MAQDLESEVNHLRREVDRLEERVRSQQAELDHLRSASESVHHRSTAEGDEELMGGADLLWRARPPLGCGVVRPHLVTLGDTVYIGGGNTRNLEMSRSVHRLSPVAAKWESLPITPYLTFALGSVGGHLTVIGGVNVISSLTSGDLIHFEPDVKKWKKTLPPMPTKRCAASAVSMDNHLVVAGGIHEDGKMYLGTVEVLDTVNLQWSHVASLPKPTTFMSMTWCKSTDRIYLLGGLTKQGSIRSIFSCLLSDLLRSASSDGEVETTKDAQSEPASGVWGDIGETPYHRMGCTAISGKLVVASGLNDNDKTTTMVHVFDPVSHKWGTIGRMAAARSSCSLVSLARGRLMVVGGYTDPRNWMASLTTDVMECVNLKLEQES